MLLISKNTKDTTKIARDFTAQILDGDNDKAVVVGLTGDLGAGKTFFTQAFAKILGITKRVNSPTFVLMKRYHLRHKFYKNFFHLDAYRLKNEKELEILGWDDIVANRENIVFIEWPERVKKSMPKNHYKINIKHTRTGNRQLKMPVIK